MEASTSTGIRELLTMSLAVEAIESVIIIVIGFFAAKLLAALVSKFFRSNGNEQVAQVTGKFIFYGISTIFLLMALENLGVELGVLLGAAGILTVAIGFASQTAVSNLISGLFLLGERPFVVGEVIEVDQTTGEVLSIDLLSVKLRTFANLFVRIPNEILIKSKISNLSRFPIRRADLQISVAYKEDIEFVKKVLMDLATSNPLCLEHPLPLFIFSGFGDSSINIQFSVWASSPNFLELRNSMYQQIKAEFDELDIEIPFPHISVYAGSASEPLQVALDNDNLGESG